MYKYAINIHGENIEFLVTLQLLRVEKMKSGSTIYL